MSDPWRDVEPIRSDLFSDEQLARHAISLADSQIEVRRTDPVVSLLARVRANGTELAKCYAELSAAAADDIALSPAAEWLIDNYHTVEENTRQIRRDLPRSYFAQLPKLGPGFLAGHPRIFAIIWAYVAHTDSLLDPEQLARYVAAYQRRKALTLGELWAVAINLRILLIENVRRSSVRIARATHDRQAADELADRLLGLNGPREEFSTALLPASQATNPSRSFAVQLLRRLSDHPSPTLNAWLDDRLAELGLTQEEAIRAEHAAQAVATVTMRNIFHSFRLINDVNWEDWLEGVSAVEAELRTNPGYSELDFATRNSYRSAVERLARGSGHQEIAVTRAALTLAEASPDEVGRDVGFWLVDDGVRRFEANLGYRPSWRERRVRAIRSAGLGGYLGTLTLGTVLLTGLVVWVLTALVGELVGWRLVLLALFVSVPLSELVLGLLNHRISKLLPTIPRPALALRSGVPEQFRTLVVIPTMITSPAGVDELMDDLEVHFLGNDDGEVYFAAATDWADAPEPEMPDDQALLGQARARVQALNQKYGDRFFLFHRERRWNPAEGVWMGWERKRGKLTELNALLRGSTQTSYIATEGLPPGRFRYVVTLDSDTRLPRDTAKKLVGKLAHPLNQAVVDEASGKVKRGFSILQPRVTPSLPSMDDTSVFQEIYSTQRGLTPYAVAISDVYQDLFGRGSFSGKGIYEIDSLEAALADRIPENAVLSHDLLEGNYARSGLVSDIEVVEEYPTSYEVDTKRQHRWTRGDWQLLPWIFGRRAGLDGLGIWKMIDNLRRSLVAICSVLGFIVALAAPSWRVGAIWLAVMVAMLLAPSLLPMVPAVFARTRDITRASKFHALGDDLRRALALGALNFVFMAHRAASAVDAIMRTLWRMLVSHRLLLEWTTAAAAAQQASGTLRRFADQMRLGLLPPLIALVVAAVTGWPHLLVAAPAVLAWLAAPLVAQRVSRELDHVEEPATPDEITELRLVARRTWGFFEAFVTADEHHLPPDNFQEDPEPRIAHRTSPTNIGLYLLTVISAHDFGWIGIGEVADRLSATVHSMRTLEHHHGHLYNWYDTRTAEPLRPRYVSSVDSGNLAGHLLVVASFCRDWLESRPAPPDVREGLLDGVRLVGQVIDELPDEQWPGGERANLRRQVADLASAVDDLGRLEELATSLVATPGLPSRVQLVADSLLRSIGSVRAERELDSDALAQIAVRLAEVEAAVRAEFDDTDFNFVFHPRRRMLSVGYNVEEAELDDSCYDLLASEARLGSYVAIAKDDVPTRHWTRLGRSVTAIGGGAALLSWSGSMFEYLMPMLVMRQPTTGLLATTCELAVQRQIGYAAQVGCPVWGISEAGYHARDPQLNYQYSPFGVPGLGLVRGLSNDLVIAPYATGLAAMIAPGAAVENYRELARLGARASYGYYEALDFTRRRLPDDERYALVRSYMAHHQGMTIVAIANLVFDGRMRDRFHDEPLVAAAELLLEERAPAHVPTSTARRGPEPEPRRTAAMTTPAERVYEGAGAMASNLQLISNGDLSLVATSAGAVGLRWRGLAINRWGERQQVPTGSDQIYLRDAESGRLFSPTAVPFGRLPEGYRAQFSEDRARYSARLDADLSATMRLQLSPEADAMVRRVTITNNGTRPRRLDAVSYSELVLGKAADDRAHPVFSKMFVRTWFADEGSVLIATRRRRSPSDPEVWAAHFVHAERGAEFVHGAPVPETDRRRFVGRGGELARPAMLAPGGAASGTVGDTLDPIFSLSQQLVIPPGERVELDWWTVVAPNREQLMIDVGRHRTAGAAERLAMLAWTQSQVQLRHLGIDSHQAGHFQNLAGRIAFPQLDMRSSTERLLAARPQSDLWSMSISGDLPILVVRINDEADLDLIGEVVRAFEYWRVHRFAVDVVFLNEEATGYAQELQLKLEAAASGIAQRTGSPDSTGRIFVVRRDTIGAATLDALLGTAAVVLLARRGSIAQQLQPAEQVDVGAKVRLAALPRRAPSVPVPLEVSAPALSFFNGFGGFNAEGDEYIVVSDPERPTPAPWTNVVANEQFGFLATAGGGGNTWWRNSRDYQLTAWRNDPVADPLSEAVYVHEAETGSLWSPQSALADGGQHTTRHGFGYTRYHYLSSEITLDQTVFVPLADPIKISLLEITNNTRRTMRLAVTGYAEVVLGQHRDRTAPYLISEVDATTGAMLARNPYSVDAPGHVVFLDLGGRHSGHSGDRTDFLGPAGTLRAPRAVLASHPLDGRVGAGLDPCLAVQREVTVGPGEKVVIPIMLGAGADLAEAHHLIGRYRNTDLAAELAGVREHWRELLERVQVNTPDKSFDLMINGWLLYQTMACRMLARAGYYQASGAYGFRDQLQDSMAAVLVDPELAREHLLRAAGRQFTEGDVQHWWLPATGAGVRTRISDDVVWLAQAATRYIDVTGDVGVLDAQVGFLVGDELAADEHERFFTPQAAAQTASLYEHCVLALRRAFAYGRYGLPLMGTGDWNDGMNRVGQDGEGESVWLGWFLHATLSAFAPLAAARGDQGFVTEITAEQARLLAALEDAGWDGQWYRRAYFDDGTPLGSSGRSECSIDGIAQSWAVLSGAAEPERAHSAMESLQTHLVDPKQQIIKLFTAPFAESEPDPGYIAAYPPGVRENGGQYTHGAVWSIFAWAALGRDDRAGASFGLINPINHALDAAAAEHYRVEPYVLAADVYAVGPYAGRGGWTWYTGSSGWLYRAGVEAIMGLRRHGDRLEIRSCLPPDWGNASVRYRHGAAHYDIEFTGTPGVGRVVLACTVDGQAVPVRDGSAIFELDAAEGTHWVSVRVGRPDGQEGSVAQTE